MTEQGDREALLATMKVRATALLVVVAAIFVVLLVVPGGDPTWLGYALAAAEGSLVGGLADWFAVTALFRHPLGIPIPHTAIIRERKDQFGATLGSFVQENFLSPEVVSERIAASGLPQRIAGRLQNPATAERLADGAIEALVELVDLVGEDDVRDFLHAELTTAVQRHSVAPLAGRVLRAAIDEGRQATLVDAALRGAVDFLDRQREPLRARFGESSRWWLPTSVERRVFDELFDATRDVLVAMALHPQHELRRDLDAGLRSLADRLEHDPELQARADEFVADLVASPTLAGWSSSLWADVSTSLREQAAEPASSALRARLVAAITAAGARLAAEPALQATLTGAAEKAARYVADHHRDEISGLISATIARWDPDETSDKLELLLGPDLQFIRINGTLVGGLAGVAIHAIAVLIG